MSFVHVFTPPSARYNLAGAAHYGTIKHHSLPSPFDTTAYMQAIAQLDIKSDDYIALTGPMLSVVFGVIAVLTGGPLADKDVNLLLFNASTGQYTVRIV